MTDLSRWTIERLDEVVSDHLPSFIGTQRWYGDKARTLTSVRVVTRSDQAMPEHACVVVWMIVECAFAQGQPSRYFTPLVISTDDGDSAANRDQIVWSSTDDARQSVVVGDALSDKRIQRVIGRSLIGESSLGPLSWSGTSALDGLSGRISEAEPRPFSAEQSNSSVRLGDVALIKLYRKMEQGINPDIELTRFLTDKTSFRGSAAQLGSLAWSVSDEDAYSIGVANEWIPSDGDCWSRSLHALTKTIGSAAASPDHDSANYVEQLPTRLGELTAGMHAALASDAWTPAMSPETITRQDTDQWSSGLVAAIAEIGQLLAERDTWPDVKTRDLVAAFGEASRRLTNTDLGFETLVGAEKIRVHGDYHLGQILVREDGNLIALDFEGEPQRRMAERRAKSSPLKDVAGMLRSLAYARGSVTARLASMGDGAVSPVDLLTWEQTAREQVLSTYEGIIREQAPRLIPASSEEFRRAVRAWELDKAAYEVKYELNNRPDWLWLPLSAFLKAA